MGLPNDDNRGGDGQEGKANEPYCRNCARQASQAKAQELVEQALTGIEDATGASSDQMDALATLGHWAAEGGR